MFLVDSSALVSELAKAQKVVFEAMEAALKGGAKLLDAKKLPADARKALATVLKSHIASVPTGMRYLFDRQDLKLGFMPDAVATLEANGVRKTINASVPLDQAAILTGSSEGDEQTATKPDEVVAPPDSGLRFYFSVDVARRRSTRLLAMSQFGLLATEQLGKDYADADAAYDRVRKLLMEQLGGMPPKSGDSSQFPKAMQDAFARDIGNGAAFQGFASRHEAEAWFYSSRIVSTHSYVSIAFGGYDTNRRQVIFGIIPFDRP